MNVRLSGRAAREYESLSPALRRRAARQFAYLAANLRHPSLNAKKYDEARDVWQGRVTRDYRFYFSIDGETYRILAIRKHPK
jgi:mRNA-degrading endonuclease RelE of RelBE toxin-antitoxin system